MEHFSQYEIAICFGSIQLGERAICFGKYKFSVDLINWENVLVKSFYTTYLPNHNNIQKFCSSVVFFLFISYSPTKWDLDLNSQFSSYCNKKNIFEMTIIFPKLVGQGNIYTLYTKIKFYCYKIKN